MKTKFFLLLLISFTLACQNTTVNTIQQPKPADSTSKSNSTMSIYQLEGTWTTQDNKTITLAELKDKVQVIAMVFTSCRYACPKITQNMLDIEKKLPPAIRNKVGFILVSFDTERDIVSKLKSFATEMKLDSNWTLLRGNDEEVRTLSMLLDVNYEKQSNGDFNHTSVINILDKNGVVVHHHDGLEMDAKAMVAKIAAMSSIK